MSSTPPSLLQQLRGAPADADAWRRFDAIYRPLLSSWLCRYSLQAHDADDVVQEILQAAAAELPRFQYEPARGHFRSWLRQIMVNRLREFWRVRKRDRAVVEPLLDQLEDPSSDLSRRWDREHDQHVLEAMLAHLEPDFTATTWQAFRQLAEGASTAAVAASLGLSVNAVLLARSRILKRLREAAQDMTD